MSTMLTAAAFLHTVIAVAVTTAPTSPRVRVDWIGASW